MSGIDSESQDILDPGSCVPELSRFSITDLIGMKHLSKPLCKLVDAVRSASGTIYEPTRIKRKAKAKAKAALIKAKSDMKLQALSDRAGQRVTQLELRRQKSIEAVVVGAAQQMPEQVSDVAPSEDWIFEFFNCCQDIGDQEMQTLWSKILAGEVSIPGTYSRRTLNLLKTMTKDDADLFTRFCCLAWKTISNDYVHFYTQETDKLILRYDLSYPKLLHLQAIGLITIQFNLGYDFRVFPEGPPDVLDFSYFGTRFEFACPSGIPKLQIRVFTQIGSELVPISGAESRFNYIQCLKDSLKPNIEMKEIA